MINKQKKVKRRYKYEVCTKCGEKARITDYRLNVRMDNGFIIESNDAKVAICKNCGHKELQDKEGVKAFIDARYAEIMHTINTEFGGIENIYNTTEKVEESEEYSL